MQQFTVPQFIDVESKIIGPITTRQFLIIIGAGVIVAISYRLFDFTLFLTVTVGVVLIASIFSFLKINGRPFHFFILNLIQTIKRPGTRVWNNRLTIFEEVDKTSFVRPIIKVLPKEVYKKSRLAELALVVDTKGRYKGEYNIMPKSSMARSSVSVSTQQYLDITEIKENTIVMKDGTLRAVLLVSSINFALKSEDEQNAVIDSYVRFLNNLTFTLQIVIQSRELDIDNYLQYLKEKEKEQTNKLLKVQTADYVEYIKELTSLGKIMNKRFYIIVPYNPLSDVRKGFFSMIGESLKPATIIKLKERTFLQYQEMLERRIDSVIGGLESMGVAVARLDTQSLIELYYKTYNPETAKNQDLVDLGKLRVEK